MNNHQGSWLSIIDYADYRGKSISTIRRYIKANRVKYKEEKGKYFIWAHSYRPSENDKELYALKIEIEQLKKLNTALIEENAEYKMLINIYEKNKSFTPPDIPMVN